jgi:hypothetical protein
MKSTKIQRGLVLGSVLVGFLTVGCELIVDFDRTKIPVEAPEASAEASVSETGTSTEEAGGGGTEAGAEDTGAQDTGIVDAAGQ